MEPAPLTEAKEFLRQVNIAKKSGVHNPTFEVECAYCNKVLKKAGLTAFNFSVKKKEGGKKQVLEAKTIVLSCDHIDYDGEPGCMCCCTIKNNKICCGDCAQWDILNGTITRQMFGSHYMWIDGTETYCGFPSKQKTKSLAKSIGTGQPKKAAESPKKPEKKKRKKPEEDLEARALRVEVKRLKQALKTAMSAMKEDQFHKKLKDFIKSSIGDL